MTNYTQELTDSMNLTDYVSRPGTSGEVNVIIDEVKVTTYTKIKVEKRLNEMNSFEIEAYVDKTMKNKFQEGKMVKIFRDNHLILKGRIDEVSWSTDYKAKLKGYGMEIQLQNRLTGRKVLKDTTGENILKYLLSENNDSSSPYILDVDWTNNVNATDSYTMRYDFDDKAKAMSKAADKMEKEWYITHSINDNYASDNLHIVDRKGSDAPVKDFKINDNLLKVDRNKEQRELANKIQFLGRGDGENQLSTTLYSASADKTNSTEEMDATQSTLSVKDTSDFPNSGTIRIGEEEIVYASKTATSFNTLARGANATKHRANMQVFNADYTPSSPQSGSSIDKNGIVEKRMMDKTIIDKVDLEKKCDTALKNRANPIYRIELTPADPRVDIVLGDDVTVTDSHIDLDGAEFRVVGIDYEYGSQGERTTLHCNNRPDEFVQEVKQVKDQSDTQSSHQQGSHNKFGDKTQENASWNTDKASSHPIELRVYIPEDVENEVGDTTINKISLNYEMGDYRKSTGRNLASTVASVTPNTPDTVDSVSPDNPSTIKSNSPNRPNTVDSVSPDNPNVVETVNPSSVTVKETTGVDSEIDSNQKSQGQTHSVSSKNTTSTAIYTPTASGGYDDFDEYVGTGSWESLAYISETGQGGYVRVVISSDGDTECVYRLVNYGYVTVESGTSQQIHKSSFDQKEIRIVSTPTYDDYIYLEIYPVTNGRTFTGFVYWYPPSSHNHTVGYQADRALSETIDYVDNDGNKITASESNISTNDENPVTSLGDASGGRVQDIGDINEVRVKSIGDSSAGRVKSVGDVNESRVKSLGDASSDRVADIENQLNTENLSATDTKIEILDNTDTVIATTNDIYGSSTAGTVSDEKIDLSEWINSPGRYNIKIYPYDSSGTALAHIFARMDVDFAKTR